MSRTAADIDHRTGRRRQVCAEVSLHDMGADHTPQRLAVGAEAVGDGNPGVFGNGAIMAQRPGLVSVNRPATRRL